MRHVPFKTSRYTLFLLLVIFFLEKLFYILMLLVPSFYLQISKVTHIRQHEEFPEIQDSHSRLLIKYFFIGQGFYSVRKIYGYDN